MQALCPSIGGGEFLEVYNFFHTRVLKSREWTQLHESKLLIFPPKIIFFFLYITHECDCLSPGESPFIGID